MENTRNRFLAGILSLLSPGLGQLYNGQNRRLAKFIGLLTLVLILFRSPLILWGGVVAMGIIFLAGILLWLGGAVDAFIQARVPRPKTSFNRWYFYILYYFLLPFVLTISIRTIYLVSAAELYRIPALSMAPSVLSGDQAVVNKWAYLFGTPKVGDIAVFRYPKDESINYVKRVIGMPGDTVEVRNKVLLVNNKEIKVTKIEDSEMKENLGEEGKDFSLLLEENGGKKYPIAVNSNSDLGADFGPVTVPENKYFVLGDNRDRSSDSRIWGFVPRENFKGRAEFIYYSTDDQSGDIRFERIGMKIN